MPMGFRVSKWKPPELERAMTKMAFSGTTGGGGFGRWAFCSGGRLKWGLSLLLPSTVNFFAPRS
jgi:hypothetical protein